MNTWIIGRGGLIGKSLTRLVPGHFDGGQIPWANGGAAAEALTCQAREFARRVGDDPWRVIWVAGQATLSSPDQVALSERVPFEGLVRGLAASCPQGPGGFFLASSAGGVYADSYPPPFSTSTPVAPVNSYGSLKLWQEHTATEFLTGKSPVVIGRLGNVYGPGQNLDKMQGLISRLALAAVTKRPIRLFAPMETLRDYLFVEDAARAILASLDEAVLQGRSRTLHVLATGHSTSIARVLRTVGEVAKRRVPVGFGDIGRNAGPQPLDLRLAPSFQLARITPLPEGVSKVYEDVRVQAMRRQPTDELNW